MTGQGQPSFTDQLESLLAHARHLESALQKERRKSRGLQEELNNAHAMFDRLVHEEKARCGELTVEVGRIRSQLVRQEQLGAELRQKCQAVDQQRRQAVEELKRYQSAWSTVVDREREAQLLVEESRRAIESAREQEQKLKALAQALESEKAAREQVERHAQGYQAELQSTLVRLHSAEGKFAELSRELQALRESRKSLDEERARLQEEAEKLRMEIEGYKKALQAESSRADSLEDALTSRAAIQTWVAQDPEIEQTQGEC